MRAALGVGGMRCHGSAPSRRVSPALPGKLLGFRWASPGAARRRRLRRASGFDPIQNITLIPAQAPRARHLERPGDQVPVLVLFAGREGPNGGAALADQSRELLNEDDSDGGRGVSEKNVDKLLPGECLRQDRGGHNASMIAESGREDLMLWQRSSLDACNGVSRAWNYGGRV